MVDENKAIIAPDLTVMRECSVKCLARELFITAATAKMQTEIDPCLRDEFKRVLIDRVLQPPEAIQWAFERWRDENSFFPAPADILKLIRLWHREQRAQREEHERKQNREANCMGLEQLRDILAPYVEKKKPAYVPLSEEELKRRRDEQLKAVREKFGEGKSDAGNDPRSNS